MENPSGPLIVRHSAASAASYARPGLHSHNKTRQMPSRVQKTGAALNRLRLWLLIVGICGVGYYGYTLSNQYVYQAYQNWAFDQEIAGRRVAFADYVREKTPFGFLVGTKTAERAEPRVASEPRIPAPTEGALLGRVEISRLNLSAIVREGVDAKTLSIAVGHVPSTALPGQPGNFAIAAHRDTLFRVLKDIKKDDLVTFQSAAGTYTYKVLATEIVKPTDVSVLRPDGGGLIAPAADARGPEKLLTMITCYPFYYVGSAPKRFIVEAKLVPAAADEPSGTQAQNTGPPAPVPEFKASTKPRSISQASLREPRVTRGSSHLHVSAARRARAKQQVHSHAPKKRGFWHRLLHV